MDDAGEAGALDNVKKTLFKTLKKAEWIEAMSYSPCGKMLAVGCSDGEIRLLNMEKGCEVHEGSGQQTPPRSRNKRRPSSSVAALT